MPETILNTYINLHILVYLASGHPNNIVTTIIPILYLLKNEA